uniref:procollagen-proline 4-dioxygenase n=1 Tax=Cyprinus carpio carpio TaxID=630221 RepID=A0A8C1F0V8_CYPCA
MDAYKQSASSLLDTYTSFCFEVLIMAVKELTILVVCSLIVCTGSEIFTSTDKISHLFGEEKFLLDAFSLYIDAEEEIVKKMKRDLLLLQLGTYSDPVDPEQIKDPVAAFILLIRLRSEWMSIEKYTSSSLSEYNVYQTVLEYAEIPQVEDLQGAALGLISLQELYKLYPHNITKETSLNAAQAYFVGFVAYNENKFQHAFLWFLYSLGRLTQYSTVTENELLRYLSDSAYHFGSLPVAIYFSQRLFNLDPTNEEVKVQLDLYRFLRYQKTSNKDIFTLINESSNSYEALCRGETSKRQMALSCRYSTGGGNPRLMYAPVKEEVEWDEPRIIRYHDIISDRDIESLKNISRPLLSRSETIGGVTNIRTSQSVFLDEGYPVVARTSKRQMALSCRYSTGGGNPRLMYAPVKEEVEWDEPRIIRYHDIISDREIEILKNISRPLLSRSETIGGVTNIRTSQSVFLDEGYPVVARVNQRIADITGLSMKSAEHLHVQNYGIGGKYEPHYDELDTENDRIATFLIYMSDVEIGGSTVFPKVGVALKPKKGSAVLWYNLHKNGNVDLNTEHAGCPVLRGNKWVANKWIHEYGQEFRRPCSLSYWK